MRQRIVALGSRPEFWLACLLLWLLGSAGRSLGTPWRVAAATEALRWSAGIGLMLALSRCRQGSEFGAKVAVVLVGLLAGLGVADGIHSDKGGMAGPYHDHQLYASALLVLLPLTAVVALTARANVWRLGGLTILAAGTLCLALSQARSAWVGGLTAVVVFGGLWLRQSGFSPQQKRKAAFSAAALLAGVAAVWILLGSASLRDPMTARAATVANLGTDGSWQARLTAWQGAGGLIETHLISGIGLGLYPGTQRVWTHAGRSLTTTMRPSLSEEAHNLYLQMTAEMGVVGLSLYLAALAAYAALGVRRLRTVQHGSLRTVPTSNEAIVIAALSTLAAQSVDACASPSWQFAETSFFFWAVLGLGWSAMRQEETAGSAALTPLPLAKHRRLFSPQVAAGMAFVALTAEILPVGLLTPVEAYTAANIKTGSVVLSASATTTAQGVPVTYQLMAQDTNGNPVNLTFDSNTVFTAGNINPPDNIYFKYLSRDTANGVMVFLIPAGTYLSSKTVKIQATFPSYLTPYSKTLVVAGS